MEKATSSWGQSVVGLALVRALWPAEGGAGVSLGFGGPRFVPRSGGEQGWEAQAGPRRKRSEAEVLEGGGRWQPLSQRAAPGRVQCWSVLDAFRPMEGREASRG